MLLTATSGSRMDVCFRQRSANQCQSACAGLQMSTGQFAGGPLASHLALLPTKLQ